MRPLSQRLRCSPCLALCVAQGRRHLSPAVAAAAPERISAPSADREVSSNTIDHLSGAKELLRDAASDVQVHYLSASGEDYVCGKVSCAKKELSDPSLLTATPIEKNLKSWIDVIPSRARGLIMLNLLVLLCGTNWVVVKETGASFDPFYFCSLRFIVATAFFAPVLFRAIRNHKTLKGGVEIGIYTAIGYLLQAEGLLTTDASRASFLSTFTVLVVPFLAGLSGKGVRPITWASATAALVGVSMLEQSGSDPTLGDLWSALSAMFFGVQMFRTEHWSRILGKDSAFDLMGVVLATTACITTAAAVATHTSFSFQSDQLSAIPWGEVFYTGLLTTDVVLLMEVYALQDVSSVEASIIYTLEPVVGALFAFVLLGERIGPVGILGASIILMSCMATQLVGGVDGEEKSMKLNE
jgi:drug/metabolite transporter (DMT)-like permease